MKSKASIIPPEVVMSKIYLVRGQKVMLDIDLASLYQVETKHLNQAVRRNLERFPRDFMFQLKISEWSALRSQFVTSNERGGRRYPPLAFTEYGVLMLSSVLNSDRAIRVNIQIMRIYTRLKEMVIDHKEILAKLEELERKFSKHDENLKIVFAYLHELLNPKSNPVRTIGFKQKGA